MTEKVKNVKFSKKFFFMNFKDMMLWVSLDENTSLRSVLNNVSCSEDLYFKKAPPFCQHRQKTTFFRELLTFEVNFCILGQQVLTKIFTWPKTPNFILQDPSFEIFISYVVPEIFLFFGSSAYSPDLKITTFIFKNPQQASLKRSSDHGFGHDRTLGCFCRLP